jgi:hypothetical protein
MKDFFASKAGTLVLMLGTILAMWGCSLLLPRVGEEQKAVVISAIGSLGIVLVAFAKSLIAPAAPVKELDK